MRRLSIHTSAETEAFYWPELLWSAYLRPKSEDSAVQETSFTPKELNEGFVVAISIEAKENEADAVAAILEGLIEPTMAEPGVKLFLPYRSPTDPRQFFLFELYANEKAWGDHQETEHFKEAIKELVPRAAKRERVPFVPYISS